MLQVHAVIADRPVSSRGAATTPEPLLNLLPVPNPSNGATQDSHIALRSASTMRRRPWCAACLHARGSLHMQKWPMAASRTAVHTQHNAAGAPWSRTMVQWQQPAHARLVDASAVRERRFKKVDLQQQRRIDLRACAIGNSYACERQAVGADARRRSARLCGGARGRWPGAHQKNATTLAKSTRRWIGTCW